MRFTFILLISVLFSLASCDSTDNNECTEMRMFIPSGLETCGFLLGVDLDDEWRTLDPINLDSFDIVPSDGLEVCATFIERPDIGNTCQVGEIVELISIVVR